MPLPQELRELLRKQKTQTKRSATMLEHSLINIKILASTGTEPAYRVAEYQYPGIVRQMRANAAKMENILERGTTDEREWKELGLSVQSAAAKLSALMMELKAAQYAQAHPEC